MKAVNCTRHILAAVLSGGLIVGFVCEVPTFAKAFFPKKAKPVAKRIAQVQRRCAKRFPLKIAFVTLNGGFVRAIGQHLCNGVVRMEPDDVLIDPNPRRVSMARPAERMAAFSSLCASNGVKFLYVQLPKRLDVAGTMLPPGEDDAAYGNADELVTELVRRQVDTLDLRQALAATTDDIRANFFRTDHHWKIGTAFRAGGVIARAIAERCPSDAESVAAANGLLSSGKWTRSVFSDAFQGSLGRRTGHLYAPKDDLVVLRPKFVTEMSMAIPERGWKRRGTFEETVMWRMDEVVRGMREDAFSIDAYTSLYVGGLYGQVRHENAGAPLKLKVLLIGDSFARPVEGFLSVVFRRLDFVDPRRCGSGFSLTDFVLREKPDAVVQMLYPGSLIARSMVGVRSRLPIMFEYGKR